MFPRGGVCLSDNFVTGIGGERDRVFLSRAVVAGPAQSRARAIPGPHAEHASS